MKHDLEHVCNYLKSLIIPRTPDNFTVAERFRHGLTNDEIFKGIAAFREFLHVLLDKLIAEKDKIDLKTRDNYNPYINADKHNIRMCLPSIYDLTIILLSFGVHGKLEIKPENRISIYGNDLFTVICPITEKYNSLNKMSGERKLEMFQLLYDLGLCFNGADFFNGVDFSKVEKFYVTHERNVFFPVGLKLISEATLNNKSYIKLNNLFLPVFLRCDFNPLANAVAKKHRIKINDIADAQAPDIRDWILDVNTLLVDNGCALTQSGGGEFTSAKRNAGIARGRLLRLHINITGCFATPGVNHLKKPVNILAELPDSMIDMIIDKKNHTHGSCGQCAGGIASAQCKIGGPIQFNYKGEDIVKCRVSDIRIPLDNANYREWVRKWIEMELDM